MDSNRSAMVDVESNLLASAEEEMAPSPVGTKPASDKMIAEDSSSQESVFAKMATEDCSEEEEVRADRFIDAQLRDEWNARFDRYFGPLEDTTNIPKKPCPERLSAEEVRAVRQDEGLRQDGSRGGLRRRGIQLLQDGSRGGLRRRGVRLRQDGSRGLLRRIGARPHLCCQGKLFQGYMGCPYSHNFGHFEDTTKIPNMRFTYKKPKVCQYPAPTATLQIFSLKVANIWGGLQWPLHVFGKVAVRDVVDHNRNMIFHHPRESCQILTQEDPYLKLTGPTRAVVLVDPLTFEVDLQVKGVTQDEDESLSFLAVTYNDFTSNLSRLVKMDYASKLSKVEFELGSIVTSVEATISLRVRLGLGSWPDGFRPRISARTASIGMAEVILLDSGDRLHLSRNGSIKLSRCVVSVEILGELEVCVKAGRGEEIVVDKNKSFKAKKDSVSHGILRLGFCTLDVTVAWSLVSPSRY